MNRNLTKAILVLTLVSLFFTACGKQTDYVNPNNNPNIVKPEDRPLYVTQFEQVHGTRYLMADIKEVGGKEYLSSSYGGGGNIHNLVFLDAESLASHRLFDTDAYIINSARQYPSNNKESDTTTRGEGKTTQWLVYQVLKTDTNGDGHLGDKDKQTIGVSDASGYGYTEVLSSIDDNMGITMTMLSVGQIVVVCSQDGVKTASVIDLGTRKVVSTKPLVDLGPYVK